MATNESENIPDVEKEYQIKEKGAKCDENGQKEIRLVLVGLTGSGKSAVGNTILGGSLKKPFRSSTDPDSATKRCVLKKAEVLGRNVAVIDTPGFFDTSKPPEAIKKEIMRCIALSSPGPHALLLVLKIGARFTKEVCSVVDMMKQAFGQQSVKYIVFLFTAGDALERDGMSGDEYVSGFEGTFQELFEECDNRYVVFDNTLTPPTSEENESQITNLLEMVEDLTAQNGSHYDVKILEEIMSRAENGEKEKAKLAEAEEKDLKKTEARQIQMSSPTIDANDYAQTMKNAEEYIRMQKAQIEDLQAQLRKKQTYNEPHAQRTQTHQPLQPKAGWDSAPQMQPSNATDVDFAQAKKNAEECIHTQNSQIQDLQSRLKIKEMEIDHYARVYKSSTHCNLL